MHYLFLGGASICLWLRYVIFDVNAFGFTFIFKISHFGVTNLKKLASSLLTVQKMCYEMELKTVTFSYDISFSSKFSFIFSFQRLMKDCQISIWLMVAVNVPFLGYIFLVATANVSKLTAKYHIFLVLTANVSYLTVKLGEFNIFYTLFKNMSLWELLNISCYNE